jgi:hypothetical protein
MGLVLHQKDRNRQVILLEAQYRKFNINNTLLKTQLQISHDCLTNIAQKPDL